MKKIDWESLRESVLGFGILVILVTVIGGGLYLFSVRDSIPQVGLLNAIKACTIKGNVNESGEKIYHLNTQEYYKETKINEDKGDRIFCTENEAINTGFRKSNASTSKQYIEDSARQRQEYEDDRCNGSAGASRGC